MADRDIYRRLLGFVRPYWRQFAGAIAAMVALAGTEWMLPALLKPLIDKDFDITQGTNAYATGGLLILLFAARGVLNYLDMIALQWVAQKTIADLRMAMFKTLVRLPANFFDGRASGELISKFTFDVTQVAQAATRVIEVLIKDSAIITVLFGYLFYLNWKLTLVLMLFAAPIGIIVRRASQRMRQMSRRLQESVGAINQVTEEAVRGHREVKVFEGYDYETGRFDRAINDARRFHMKVVGSSATIVPLIQLCVAVGISLMVVLAVQAASDGIMTRGDFIAFVTATALVLPPTKRLAGVNEFLQRGLAAADSIFALADAEPEVDEGREDRPVTGAIRFEHVTLRYGERTALEDICLDITAGETVALVGRSGGGKTSLVNLVPRFYPLTSGRLLVDGVPVENYRLAALRRHIAYVGQHIVLFNGTLYDNIAYGALRDVDRADVERVVAQAQVKAFADSLPQGLDTLIGENGVKLSGGQRQRVAIARALLKDAPILILDEATAALDNEAERLVQEALNTVRRGRTSLIVAHRLSTIEQADSIVVLDHGRIVERGTHRELLAAGGAYARLYSAGFEELPTV
ncbi:MAG: lipid A export permease/ATP-binding protein MsbA [Gammaproteobacteria bacterium]|nr:lipid A export permease/ATP-binding protein MsbA [Gammaproteobacteria bacterium]